MAAPSKIFGHGAALTLSAVALPIVLFIAWLPGASLDLAAQLGAVAAGLAALAHLAIALYDPNANRQANRLRSQNEVKARRMEVVQAGRPAAEQVPGPAHLTARHAGALAAVVAAALVFLAPLVVRWTSHLPSNSGLQPEVVGPGDQVTVWFPDQPVRSVRGKWRGTPRVELLNAAELGGPPTLEATGTDATWGDAISVKASDENDLANPYARITLPKGPGVSGKALRLRASMTVTYPSLQGFDRFVDRTAAVSRELTVQVAEEGPCRAYHAAWDYGSLAGAVASVLGGMALLGMARALRGRAEPSVAVPLGA
jgi:hypothetical protein